MARTVCYVGYTANTLGSSNLFNLNMVRPGRLIGVRMFGIIQPNGASFAHGLANLLLNGSASANAATNDPQREITLASIAFASNASASSSQAEAYNSGYIPLLIPVAVGDRITANSVSGGTPLLWILSANVYVQEA